MPKIYMKGVDTITIDLYHIIKPVHFPIQQYKNRFFERPDHE